ncbi:hypothetical protein [Gordonia sp. NPDC003376]
MTTESKRSTWWIWVAVPVLVLAAIVAMIAANTSDDPSPEEREAARVEAVTDPHNLDSAATVACEHALKDAAYNPGSVETRRVQVTTPSSRYGEWEVTGEVNAQNRLGGMAGYRRFECLVTWTGEDRVMRATVTGPA